MVLIVAIQMMWLIKDRKLSVAMTSEAGYKVEIIELWDGSDNFYLLLFPMRQRDTLSALQVKVKLAFHRGSCKSNCGSSLVDGWLSRLTNGASAAAGD
jgi:hypothetical protein